ncbi:DUF4440 domain-containing protein [Bacillus sp. S13(2024)]|uniref:DUF4440 domain-containing protein n=1 Tax=unclassified Bacillus (in: firmicutes) TaxID=185979 RepID=UPI003D1AD8C2
MKNNSNLKTNMRISAEELLKILADDYFKFDNSKNIKIRKNYKDDHSLLPDNLLILSFDIHVLSSKYVLTIHKIFNETKGIKTIHSSIWRKKDSNWNLFFQQETKIN